MRTQAVIYGLLLFGGYLARVVVLIEHVGLSLHQWFLTLRVLNLFNFCHKTETDKANITFFLFLCTVLEIV